MLALTGDRSLPIRLLFRIFKQSFRITTRVFNGLDPDQDLSVGPDQVSNCSLGLFADDKSMSNLNGLC